ncbi:hypothetical protein DPX16_22578 [Anabarilius grahami]|uniref:Uncharacterized protein n=1 Tax=Anabarilius grahami TaxID=495550 RepID=A0A3N0XIM5_ANAGA|nr:hypothetical protein DPX16_22578 [Anabarilius grahami]
MAGVGIPPGPMRTPDCMHKERDRSLEERRALHLTVTVTRLHSIQVLTVRLIMPDLKVTCRKLPKVLQHSEEMQSTIQAGKSVS